MASEPDNLILVHLREIRATLSDHSTRFERIDERFAQIDKHFDEMRMLLGHTIGLSNMSYLRSQELDQRYELREGEQRRLRERVDQLDRRLAKVEEKLDG